MFKKIIISGAALALVAFLVFGGSAVARLSQGVSWVRTQVQESVPVEYELERARSMIDEMAPEIRECRRVIAEKQVELKYLDRELGSLESRYQNSREKLSLQSVALQENRASYHFLGRKVSRKEMQRDAGRRFERVKSAKAILESKYERRQALTQALDSAKTTLAELETQQMRLKVECDTLEAKLRESEAKKAVTLNLDVDKSRLAKVKNILDDVQRRLDVELQLIENESPLIGEGEEIPVDAAELGDQISAWLEGPTEIKPAEVTVIMPEAVANER